MSNPNRMDAYGRELEIGDVVTGNWGQQMAPILMEVLDFTAKLVVIHRIDGKSSRASGGGWKTDRQFKPGDVINLNASVLVLLHRQHDKFSLPDPMKIGFQAMIELAHLTNEPGQKK